MNVSSDASPDREIVSARVFDSPRDKVYDAWTDPAKLARWWGPKDFTNEFETFDPRPGGAWRFTMRGPDGTAYPQHSVFVEVVAQKRIVFDHHPPHAYRGVVTFESKGTGTRVTFRMIDKTTEECEQAKPYVVPGNEQNFDRIETILAEGHPKS